MDEALDGYVPILRAGNISSQLNLADNLLWVPECRVSEKQHLKIDDVVICMSSGSKAIVGKCAPLETDWRGSVGAFCAIIRPNSNLIVPAFLSYFLKSPAFRQWNSKSEGINIKNIRKSVLESYRLSLPSLAEQRRIVDILSRAEGIVRLRREAQKKAAEVIPALFLDMFGDPATNPKGWPVVSIGDVIVAADYGSSKKASDYGVGIPFIRMGNVDYAGYTDLSNLKYLELPPKEIEKYRLQEGDILFNRTNSKELVGKTGLWDGSCEAIAASYFIRLRVKRKILNPFYLWVFLNTAYMKRVLFETARGAIGQSNINAKELKAFIIGLPSINLQNDFERRCSDLFAIKTQQSAATVKAEATFDALLAHNFSG
ncbi:MAG: restriction endonuclease subunit S [Methylococcales bacterium]